MSVDETLREAVISFVDRNDVSMTPVADLNRSAARRVRRRRAAGALGTMSVVLLLVVAVGLSRRGPETSDVFAGQDEAPNTAPSSAVWVGDRFVGVARDDGPVFDLRDTTFRIVASDDGETWEHVSRSPDFEAVTITIGEHDGTFHLVGTRTVPADVTNEQITEQIFHATSTDLERWSEQTHPMPSTLVLDDHRVLAQEIVIQDSGVLALYLVSPDPAIRQAASEADLARLGYERNEICDMTVYADGRGDLRLCGEEGSVKVDMEETGAITDPAYTTHVLFAPAGGAFSAIELDSETTNPPWPRLASIYSAGSGFGISGLGNYESVDGTNWKPFATGEDVAPIVAARGDERMFRSAQPVRRFGADDPVVGMAYAADGEQWQSIEVEDFYVEQQLDRTPSHYPGIVGAEAGWILIVQNRTLTSESPPGVEVTRASSTSSDFIVTIDGSVLTGTTPYGPATLRNAEGRIVRAWDHFEVKNARWSGLEVGPDGIAIRHEITGELLMKISREQWAALVHLPSRSPSLIIDVWFSPDGEQWDIIDTSMAQANVLAIGPNSMLVSRSPLGWYEPTAPQLETIVFPQPVN